jgi:hypothetical protein
MLVLDGSNDILLLGAPIQEEPGADSVSLGAVSTEVDGTGPLLSNDVGGPPCYPVVRHTGLGMPGSATLGDAIVAPESSAAAGPGTVGLFLLSSPDSTLPPIDWRQVEGDIGFACL